MCSGSIVQNMGTASRLIRLMILILLGIILWRIWYYVSPTPQVTNFPPAVVVRGKDAVSYRTEHLEIAVPPELKVVVYYEALCPDSRDFIVRELKPTYQSMKDVIDLKLVPYGKAQSQILKDGTFSFNCQHGPVECQANTIHACVAKHVKDTSKSLDIVSCMIDVNIRSRSPTDDGRTCVTQYNEDWASIEKCASGKEGNEMMYHMGKMTHDLKPAVTFIPTITINDSRENQNLILRDFKKAACNLLSGPHTPEICNRL